MANAPTAMSGMVTSSQSREKVIAGAAARALAMGLVAAIGCEQPARHRGDIGQWIWSARDSALFADASRAVPGLVPAVWVGTVGATPAGAVQSRLALSPRVAARPRVAVVVRFDDSFTRAWDGRTDTEVGADLSAALRRLVTAAEVTGVSLAEVQLDYDCPDRLLPRWSAVVGGLAGDALAGRTVWVTSLVTHMRRRDYGDLFRDHVAGHILQVFDTGDHMSLSYARQIQRLTTRQRMPFRLGVAAFERTLANGRVSDHRAWFGAERVMAASRWYRGLWVFPGGRPWTPLMEQLQ